MREPDVGAQRDQWFPAAPLELEVGSGEFLAAGERGPGALGAPDQRFLFPQRGAVPDFDVHPYPARHKVRAAGHPALFRARSLACPHVLPKQGGVLGFEVVGAVLEAEEVPRCGL
ncbi:hypothetical protein NicSoilC12_31030 [Arthrobacter sp. NicSoilC12]|nr:hypothetical protein NicSoilC12_31030 [Arthrobacter sp. NicSoilC12]